MWSLLVAKLRRGVECGAGVMAVLVILGLLLAPALADVEVAKDGPRTVVSFSREIGDDRLDRGLRAILANGTRVVSCETERASLLEVLEAYEREESKP